jgi:pimeloyl-ACP methyl ester carboxylesterase
MLLNHHRAGTGEPLVLMHGIGSHWQVWEPVLDRLTPSRDVIALDLPGFGSSPRPAAGVPPGPDSLVSLVSGFLEEIGVHRPHVAGNSLGGLLALELAKRGQVRSATALSPAGFANRAESLRARLLLTMSFRAARLLAPRADALLQATAARALALNLFFAHPTRLSPVQAADSVRALAGSPWFESTLPTVGARAFRSDGLIELRVTIAWGEKDRVLAPRQARRAACAIANARMVTLYGCGHVPTYDDPERVAEILLEGSAPD